MGKRSTRTVDTGAIARAADKRARDGIPEPHTGLDKRVDAETAAWVDAHGTDDDKALFAQGLGESASLSLDGEGGLLSVMFGDDLMAHETAGILTFRGGQTSSSNPDIPAGRGKATVTDHKAYTRKRITKEAHKPCHVLQVVGHSTRTYTINVRAQRSQRRSTIAKQAAPWQESPRTQPTGQGSRGGMTAAERQRKSRERRRKGTFATF